MAAEVLRGGISYIPKDAKLRQLVDPEVVVVAIPKDKQILTLPIDFEQVQAQAGLSPRFSSILGFGSLNMQWHERRAKRPGKRDPKVYLGHDGQDYYHTKNSFPPEQKLLGDPTATAVATVIVEQGIDTRQSKSNRIPVFLHAAGLVRVDSEQVAKDSARGQDVFVGKQRQQRIFGATFDMVGGASPLIAAFVSLSPDEERYAIELANEYPFAYYDQLFFPIPSHGTEPRKTPGFITPEMKDRTDHTNAIILQRTPDGNVYFGTRPANSKDPGFVKIQEFAEAMGFRIVENHNKFTVVYDESSAVDRDSGTEFNRWRLTVPMAA